MSVGYSWWAGDTFEMAATEQGYCNIHLPEPTEQERSVIVLVRRYLAEARLKKVTGRITFELDLQDGGVTNKWSTVRLKEK